MFWIFCEPIACFQAEITEVPACSVQAIGLHEKICNKVDGRRLSDTVAPTVDKSSMANASWLHCNRSWTVCLR